MINKYIRLLHLKDWAVTVLQTERERDVSI